MSRFNKAVLFAFTLAALIWVIAVYFIKEKLHDEPPQTPFKENVSPHANWETRPYYEATAGHDKG